MTATRTTSLAEIVDRPSWMNRASCRGHPPEWWFPQRGESAERALEICGGMTARARVRARRRRIRLLEEEIHDR